MTKSGETIIKDYSNIERERSQEMDEKNKTDDKSSWAIGGGVLMGIGAGFFFLKESPLAFVACILLGLGLGLIMGALISKIKG